jgi:cell wall-associated NlpC family hydrolase
MRQLPGQGRWQFEGVGFFSALEADFNRGCGFLECGTVRYRLGQVVVIGANRFGAHYTTLAHKGLLEGEYQDDQSLHVKFIGTIKCEYTLKASTGTILGLATMAPLSPTVPLIPDAGGICIGESALQPADIIVSAGYGAVSQVIRTATRSTVSHAALYVGRGEVIEAIGEGVTRQNLYHSLEEHYLAVAYRVRTLTANAARAVISAAQGWIGKKYDVPGAIGGRQTRALDLVVSGISPAAGIVASLSSSGKLKNQDRFYCSQLVLEAYRRAGAPIATQSPNTSNPNNLVQAYSQGKLLYVGHLLA